MTKQEIHAIDAAINNLADATDTLTGTDRDAVVGLMQKLSNLSGEPFDVEGWLAEHMAAGE